MTLYQLKKNIVALSQRMGATLELRSEDYHSFIVKLHTRNYYYAIVANSRGRIEAWAVSHYYAEGVGFQKQLLVKGPFSLRTWEAVEQSILEYDTATGRWSGRARKA